MGFIISLGITLFISLIAFKQSFFLGLGGDEYLSLLDYLRNLGSHNFINPSFFLWQYGPQDTFFGILTKIYGLNSTYFYIISFILRILASASFYPLITYITKNSKSAFLSMLFFAIAATGLETTSWAFNMLGYFAILCLNSFLFLYLKSKLENRFVLYLASLLLLLLTIIISPTRMVGLVIFMPLIEIYILINSFSFKNIFYFIRNIIFFAMGVFLIFYIGESLGNGKTWQDRIYHAWGTRAVYNNGSITNLALKTKLQIFLNPITQIGAVFIPDKLILRGNLNMQKNISFFYISVSFFTFLLFLNLFKLRRKIFIPAGMIYSILLIYFVYQKIPIITTNAYVLWLSAGGFFLIAFLGLIFEIRNRLLKLSTIVFLIWIASSISVFWLRFPNEVQITTNRYLITPLVGVTGLIGILSSLKLINYKRGKLFFLLMFILFAANFMTTYTYLKNLFIVRNKVLTDKIRGSLPDISKLNLQTQKGQPMVFYFEGDNPEVLYHSIMFGFPAIVAIQGGMLSSPNLVYSDNWQEIESDYLNGSSLKRFSWPEKPVPINNIFSYKILKDELIDTTQSTREKLKNLGK